MQLLKYLSAGLLITQLCSTAKFSLQFGCLFEQTSNVQLLHNKIPQLIRDYIYALLVDFYVYLLLQLPRKYTYQ